MVGFPGETEEQFNELAEFVQEVEFDRLGCFAYSAEENTVAARMADQVDAQVKQDRLENIMDAQMTIMARKCEERIGEIVPVLVEGYDRYAGSFFGRTPWDAPEVDGNIFFTGKTRSLNAGEIARVQITDCMDCDLLGELVSREKK
jgi:ribosomal protein S12 methylthiotransferase